MTEPIQHLIDAITLGSLYALVAPGIALIFGIMRLVNFAHGELIMVAGYAVIFTADLAWPIVVVVALLAAGAAAVAMERVAFRPVRGGSPATLLVTSFAVSYFLQYLALVVFGATPRTTDFASGLTGSISIGSFIVPILSLVTIGVTAVIVGGLSFFLLRTSYGLHMRAAAEDFRTARVLGVRSDTVIAGAFALSGLMAGVAAILTVAQTGSVYPAMGLELLLVGFIAAVVGGLGSLRGAIVGSYVLALIVVVLQAYLPADWRDYSQALAYVAVIAVLVLRPTGLVKSKAMEVRV